MGCEVALAVLVSSVVCDLAGSARVAIAEGDATASAQIQQFIVDGTTAYQLIHEDGDESMGPRLALERFRAECTEEEESKTTFALVYGWGKDTRGLPVRWRFSQDSIYMGLYVTTAGAAFPGSLLQFRISEFDSGRPVRGRAEGRKRADSTLSHLSIQLTPISKAITGMLVLTETGYGPPRRLNRQTVQYDFLILKGEVAVLYMTVDGVLSKWQHDGKEWIHKRNFDLAVHGEFVVLDEGNAIVSLRDEEWCVVQDIAADDPVVHSIAPRVIGEPLVVIHDVGQRVEYLEHSGMVYDRTGKEILRLPESPTRAERMAALVELVQSNRR